MALDIDLREPGGNQLPIDRFPLIGAEFLADTEGADLVMTETAHALVVLAQQHVGEIGDAEALIGAVDARQRLLRRDGAVPGLHRGQAGVAVAAGRGQRLAEVVEHDATAAFGALAQADQGVELVQLDTDEALLGRRVLDDAPHRDHVGQARR
jgi:hypothetical protein